MVKKEKKELGLKRQTSVWSPGEPKPNLVIGLGNPGTKYENTYHNVGHLFLEYFKEKTKQNWETSKNRRFEYIKDGKILFVKTLSFMNESGEAVNFALKLFGLKPNNIVIAHDDSDLIVGEYKLSRDRNSAGHKGIDSVIKHLRTKNFWRFRIGIRPENERTRSKAEKFVLKKIKKQDLLKFYSVFNEVIEKLIVKVIP